MHVHNSGINCQSDTESDFDFGSDYGAISLAHKREGLSKCLELIVYFLDVHIFNVPSTVIREGWSIMADIVRWICMQGSLRSRIIFLACALVKDCLRAN